ncbi:MAG: hypothetical protein ABI885_19900 [Gammaproteobacteria bacterium]
MRHVSELDVSFDLNDNTPQYRLPGFTTADVRAGIYSGSARIQFYVRNVFHSRGQISAITAYSLAGGPAQVSILQPRTVGLNVDMHF